MPGGRPRKFKTEKELQKKIDEYFETLGDNKATITGLCLYLGFCDRHSFYDYEKEGEFSHTIKAARCRVESVYEQNLHSGNASGSIFALKNFGWKDKQEVESTGKTVVIIQGDDANLL